nr:seminal metalloprotease 1 isoform X1 [Helicoverpa armigera]
MWSAIVVLSLVGCAVAGPPVTRSRKDIEGFRAYLERSRTDDGLRLESRMLANPKASAWENSGKFQGDILLNDKQAELLEQQYAGVAARNAYIWPNTKWPRNTVVYDFNNEFTHAQIIAIHSAMLEIEEHTCIRFRRKTILDRHYVRITGKPDGCYASLGYWKDIPVHILNLGKAAPGEGCFINSIIIHEWFHILGFLHMHSTYNRDDYVDLLWENMKPGYEFEFERFEYDVADNLDLPYEYASVMHYDRFAFSNNGRPTMLPVHEDYGLMGQLDHVTGWDWHRVNRHYNCPHAWSSEEFSDESYEHEYKGEENAALEDAQEDVAEDLPQEEVVEDLPQEEIAPDTPQDFVAEKVSVVDN